MARVKHGSMAVFLEPNEFKPDEVITVEYSLLLDDGTDVWTVDGHDGIVIYGSPEQLIAFSEQLRAAAIAKLSERKAKTWPISTVEPTSTCTNPDCVNGLVEYGTDEHGGAEPCTECEAGRGLVLEPEAVV